VREARPFINTYIIKGEEDCWSDTPWNEKIRRCRVVDIAEKVREARLRWYGLGLGGFA
jgi:hypothetical protein